MSEFKDFFIEDFDDADVVEKVVRIGGKEKKMKFKPITASKGDEIRKSCRRAVVKNGVKYVETDQDAFVAKLIIETTVYPDFKNAELQKNWGVIGAENLLEAMKSKMLDGEYAELAAIVNEVNGYEKKFEEMVEEQKN